ncbi:hypothetical protein [Halodurantibacterium flavum]|uniref:Uncharacterized protein n=1 Tax=Halodurantibacterium flavum TaxID=1382802 RepID=A0ABW4SA86_9RHOB
MSLNPILLVGGSGIFDQHAAGYLREARPDVPLPIGGRDLDRRSASRTRSEMRRASAHANGRVQYPIDQVLSPWISGFILGIHLVAQGSPTTAITAVAAVVPFGDCLAAVLLFGLWR